ncbi:uncharacterized protein LOC108916742 isoform X2 [Anoplophora glabripennis]|uniref:uncharacterized protein LOC108916742 isoform X2 n=1 Tax=Anoplophora glabripennis TaxID=217634 RepID=UPI00087562AA|nr:uncharacterized protein LOC108916742 isoform X2 [Anoplophora glabripennis]
MAFKINHSHWEVLVDFMEKHPDLARGSFSGPNGKQEMKKLWQQLSNILNAIGMGERSTEKWQKVPTDDLLEQCDIVIGDALLNSDRIKKWTQLVNEMKKSM